MLPCGIFPLLPSKITRIYPFATAGLSRLCSSTHSDACALRAACGSCCGFFTKSGPHAMVRCEQGYLCDVCKQEVESIRDSDLYLRFVIGELPSRHLLAAPERHLRCNPVNAQFIDSRISSPCL